MIPMGGMMGGFGGGGMGGNQMMQQFQAKMKKYMKAQMSGNYISPEQAAEAHRKNFRGRLNTYHQKFPWRAPSPPVVELETTEGELPNQTYTYCCTFEVDGEEYQTSGNAKSKKNASKNACEQMVKLVKKLGNRDPPAEYVAAQEARKEQKKLGIKRSLSDLAQNPTEQNALMLLHQLAQRNNGTYSWGEQAKGKIPDQTFTMYCKFKMNGKKYPTTEATGPKKKDAKRTAALEMVRQLGSAAFADDDTEERPAKKAKTSKPTTW